VSRWITSVDFRAGIPENEAYWSVYARWTRQNKKSRTGRYRFYLVHGWDSRAVANGQYTVEVAASDTRGNRGIARFAITVANRAQRPLP
jgi:hypothetical protein